MGHRLPHQACFLIASAALEETGNLGHLYTLGRLGVRPRLVSLGGIRSATSESSRAAPRVLYARAHRKLHQVLVEFIL